MKSTQCETDNTLGSVCDSLLRALSSDHRTTYLLNVLVYLQEQGFIVPAALTDPKPPVICIHLRSLS